jgi:hypothetical protein
MNRTFIITQKGPQFSPSIGSVKSVKRMRHPANPEVVRISHHLVPAEATKHLGKPGKQQPKDYLSIVNEDHENAQKIAHYAAVYKRPKDFVFQPVSGQFISTSQD